MKTKSKTAAAKRDAADIAFGVLPSLIGYQLRQAQLAIFGDFQETIGAHAITPGLFGVLVVIDANPGLKQTTLARAIHLDRSTVVSVIDKLEARKLVARRHADGDRRSNALWLTSDGKALLGKLTGLVRAHEERLVAGFSQADRARLARLLQRILHAKSSQA
jgi:DNA-binding MarR family transcriptional regulator